MLLRLLLILSLCWASPSSAQQLLAGASNGSAPASSLGNEAAWYIDTSTGKIYGPKTFGRWGASSSSMTDWLSNLTGAQVIGGAWTFSSMVTGAVGFTATTGGVTATAGNIVATAGNISATVGSVSAGTTVTGGTGVVATTGNIVATAGAVSANTTVTGGTGVVATTGNVTSTAGNVVATVGAVTAGTTVTGGTGVSATTGDVVAVAGNVVAKTALTASAALPTISSCGTSPPAATAGSSNNAGQFTLGTGTPTACTVTFSATYANYAYCTVTPASSGGAAISGGYYISAQSNAAFTLTIGTGTDSLVFNYTCVGN